MPTIDIALASDQRGAEGVLVAAYSAMEAASRPVRIWVIEDGVDAAAQSGLIAAWQNNSRFESARFISLRDLPLKFPIWWDHGRWPLCACARFQLASILPKDVSRCVYLDYDTLTATDLSALVDLDMRDCPVAMVPNFGLAPADRDYVSGLGIDPDKYCNSGVLLIDVEAWRREDVAPKLIAHGEAMSPKLRFFDQDILNSFFNGRCLLLEERWNLRDAAADPKGNIIHFAGAEKPWSVSPEAALAAHRAWLEVRAKLDFRDEPSKRGAGLRRRLVVLWARILRQLISMKRGD